MAELAPSFCMPACCLYNARQPQTLRQNPKAGIRRWRLFDLEDWAAYLLVGLVLAVPISLLISWY